jgi:hypothetical protein
VALQGHPELFPQLAAELVQLKPDVLLVKSDPVAQKVTHLSSRRLECHAIALPLERLKGSAFRALDMATVIVVVAKLVIGRSPG